MARTDLEIIELVHAGDSSVFRELVLRYQDRGFSLAMRLLRNREDAEEALQDAFIRAYNGLGGFRQDAKFGTWFYRIVYNVCLTRIDRTRTFPTQETVADVDEDIALEVAGDGPTPIDELEQRELAVFVRTEVGKMPDHYRVVLSLFYLQELSCEEIGEVVGLPVGTVKTHLFRARSVLHNQLSRSFTGKELLL